MYVQNHNPKNTILVYTYLIIKNIQNETGTIEKILSLYVNDCSWWYGLGIGLRAATMVRAQSLKVILAAPRLYNHKQPLIIY